MSKTTTDRIRWHIRVVAWLGLMGPLCFSNVDSLATVVWVHPQHSSIAEVEWNSQSQRFEVALKLNGAELEAELSGSHQQAVNLEHTPGAEDIVRRYVQQHVSITTATRPVCRFRWVGMEVEVKDVWIYFELQPTAQRARTLPLDNASIASIDSPISATPPAVQFTSSDSPTAASDVGDAQDGQEVFDQREAVDTLTEVRLSNTLLLTSRPAQINLMTLLVEGRRQSVHLSAEQTQAVLLPETFGEASDGDRAENSSARLPQD